MQSRNLKREEEEERRDRRERGREEPRNNKIGVIYY